MQILKNLFSLSILLLIFISSTYSQTIITPYKDKYGNELKVEFNTRDGGAHRIHGIKLNISKLGINNAGLDKNGIESITKKLTEDYREILKISYGNLKLKMIENSTEIRSINYMQTYKNLPVINSEFGYSLDKEGNIISLGSDTFEKIDISIHPIVSINQAVSTAKNIFGNNDDEKLKQESELVVYPIVENGSNKFLLCWLIKLAYTSGIKSLSYLIDANNGSLIVTIDNTRENFGGKVTVGYWPLYPTDTPNNGPLKNSTVRLYNVNMNLLTTSNTNSNGEYSFSVGMGPYFIIFSLSDNYGEIFDGYASNASIFETIKISGIYTENKNWEISEASNLKWHMSKVHDFYKSTFSYSNMDYTMKGHINSGANINGLADGTDIFFGSQSGYYWVRNADVIYHEYTHNVIYHIYGGFIEPGSTRYSQAYAMDEGLSDFYAGDITNDPLISEGVGTINSRNLSNNLSWDPTKEGHYNGQVIGGACWDIRQSIGPNVTEQLVFRALQLSPKARNFQDFLQNLLLADNTLYNGIYSNSILTAFNNHNIQPIILSSTITGPVSLIPNQTGTWTVSVSGGVPPYSYAWSYQPVCNSGGGIAVAPCGYWYDLYITTNTLSRYDTRDFEIKCIVKDAINQQTTVSHYISINSSLAKLQENFEEKSIREIPEKLELNQNYPNPFNPTTTIKYSIIEKGYVSLKVYDILGNLISTLVEDIKNPGSYGVKFDGATLPSGVYFYKLSVNNFTSINKMLLIK